MSGGGVAFPISSHKKNKGVPVGVVATATAVPTKEDIGKFRTRSASVKENV